MQKRIFDLTLAVLLSIAALFCLFHLTDNDANVSAAPLAAAPTINEVAPTTGPNDLDTPLVITGTDFVSTPTVFVGETALDDVNWMSSTRLEAVVPWSLDPGVYTLTVENPGGDAVSLTDAFTVTEAIGVWNAGALYGGNVNEVAVVSQTPEIVYAVSHDVGMFRSEDSAGSWSFQVAGGTYGVRNLAVSPVSPTLVYMFMPYSLHRSEDGGDTWTRLDTPGEIPFPHPTDADTLFASKRGENESGLWKSTDYGETWTDVTTGLTDTRVNDMVFNPTDPMTIYVGTEEGNIFVSSDGGDSWGFVAHPVQLVQELAINPQGDHELWVSDCCFCQPRTLRSTNLSHTTWTTVTDPVGSTRLTSIKFAPDGWGTLYSQTILVSGCFEEVYSTTNGGDSWTSIDPQSGEWHWGLGLHPSDPNELYATGNHRGIYKTTDGGANWHVANEGLTALVPDQMATVPGEPGTVYAVTDIGLMKGTQGGETWQSLSIDVGNHGFVATDPFTPDRLYVAGGDVGMGSDIPVYISEDGGQTWPITSYLTEPIRYDEYVHGNPFIRPDPSHPGVLLAGVRHAVIEPGGAEAGSLYRSTDAGLSWSEVDVGKPISPVQDIAFDVLTPTIIYMATGGEWHNTGGLFRSLNDGSTWERVDAPELDFIEDIAVEPAAPYRVFVLADNTVYISDDHGDSWEATGLSRGDIEQILCTDEDPSTLYSATGMGLLRSTNGGGSWERASGGLGWVPVYSLATVTDTDRVFLYAGTTGGAVQDTRSQALGAAGLTAAAEETLVNPGVYRNTSPRSQQIAPGQPGWVKVADGGFGNVGNFILRSLASFDGDLYAGTRNDSGAELWRSEGGSTWQQITPAWLPTQTAIFALQSYGSHLYLGTGTESGAPCEIWRSDDGVKWTEVMTDGFDDVDNRRVRAMAVFSDALYAGIENTATGLEIWRSTSGDPATWSQVNTDSFGEAGITDLPRMVVYSDTLYVGVRHDGLAELWRSDDGATWTPVFTDGLGNPNNLGVYSLAEFDGNLYVGTLNFSDGGEIWRFDGDAEWTKLVDRGAGNPDNVGVAVLEAFGQQLHAVFHNAPTGAEAWQTADGSTWERTNLNGWGDSNNGCFGAATVFDHALYVGTVNWEGAEVWRYGFKVYLPLVLRDAP